MKRWTEFQKRLAAAVGATLIVLGSLMIVDQLVPPPDRTAVYCVPDQVSGLWYCSQDQVVVHAPQR